jgi:hypothetical protein
LNEVYDESLRRRDANVDWQLVCALLVSKAGGRLELDEREYHYAKEWARRGYSITRTDNDRLRQLIVIEANPELHNIAKLQSHYMAGPVYPSAGPPAAAAVASADTLMKQLMKTISPPQKLPEKIDFTPDPPSSVAGPVKKRKRSDASRNRIHNGG